MQAELHWLLGVETKTFVEIDNQYDLENNCGDSTIFCTTNVDIKHLGHIYCR